MASVKSEAQAREVYNGGTFDAATVTVNPADSNGGVTEIPGSTNGVELKAFRTISDGSGNSDQSQLISYQENAEQPDGTSGLGKASYNMINSILGAGIIGLPFAVAQAGFILGTVLLFVMAILTDFSLRLLVESGLIIGVTSYQATMERLFGRFGFYYLSACQFFYPFFAMIGYTVIVGDTVPKVLEQAGAGGVLISPLFIKFVVTVVIMWPLSLYRDISKLGKVSFLAIVFIVFLCITVLIRAGTGINEQQIAERKDYMYFNTHIAESLSIMTFAYMCHHNTFLIYSSLERATLKRYSSVVHVSVFASAFVAFSLALGGYITFRSDIEGDLLENYCIDDTLVNVARVGYAFVVMFTFPIEMFVCREVISILVSWYRNRNHSTDSLPFHITTTLITGVVILAIGLPVGNLGVVLEFSGALFGTPLAFVFPPALYLRATKGEPFKYKRISAILLLVYGVVLTIMGTVMAIIQATQGLGETADPSYCLANTSSVLNATTYSTMSTIMATTVST